MEATRSDKMERQLVVRSRNAKGRAQPMFIISATATAVKPKPDLGAILSKAANRALGGGLPGACAMALQVLSLMWMRTTINYQYRYGTSTLVAFRTLYADGGIPRFYRGLGPALLQAPLSRFGDTAANAGSLALLDSFEATSSLPVGVKTLVASLSAGAFRILLMPIDATKTIMQVEGKNGLPMLISKVSKNGPTVLFHGALAASLATIVGHYPWFCTYNFLNHRIPQYDELPKRLLRSAFIGFCSSAISDTCSNSIRVIKTTRQTAGSSMGYVDVVKMIVEKEGLGGLFGRGLSTKIISNGIQGIMFTVLWRLGQDYMAKKEAEKAALPVLAK